MAPPPGGPPDRAPPMLVSTTPDSVAVVEGFDGWVEFQFDEVISEGGQPSFGLGTGGLERLITISPDTGVPRVRWKRNRLEVRPKYGWAPNRTYRIEIAPELADLRGNRTRAPFVVTLATGGTLPNTALRGRAVNWTEVKFQPRALIEATLLPDSLVYRTVTDSVGRFAFGPLPAGEYLVTATVDQNTNRRRDAREAWDTVRVSAGSSDVGEIWAFARDTLPPRVESASRTDSFTVTLTLSQPVDPMLRLTADSIDVLVLPDSTRIDAATALPALVHDSIYKPIDEARRAAAAARAKAIADSMRAANDTTRADSAAAPVDTTRAAPAAPRPPAAAAAGKAATPDTTDKPTQVRPAIAPRLAIRVQLPLPDSSRVLVRVRGVRAVGGAVGTVQTIIDIPPAPKPPAPTPTDSTKAAADSAPVPPPRAARDSTQRPRR
jgi:hypothetical protein